ncbi:hypothetical protein [Burkholderia stagnalis]|uniref:hypothetical protein n=1 Tax=Burkholderia stagnalis TaxID=1503054 RepID=UPI00075BB1C7|nr:hypothetical protein [Burkholderia stagnalis]KVL84969.1 hypothetical protein WT02_04950 [Burkholderia stagnalis]KVL94716.1 hypothetical protein WT03_13705 [Burkholderia stagnalis]KVM06205.1 hypothetical protein WT04_23160 [Burkholderia stagnalis]
MTTITCVTSGGTSIVAWIAAILAIIGWWATHFFSEARERRKEVRSSLDKTIASISNLRMDAIAFHEGDCFHEDKPQELQTAIYSLQRTLDRIPILDRRELSGILKNLRQSITLRNFDRSVFDQQAHGSEIVEGISDACAELEDELDRQYAAHYPHQFPYILPNVYVRRRSAVNGWLSRARGWFG